MIKRQDQVVFYESSNPKSANMDLSCIDLFSGAGGMAEGFRQAGFGILSASDIDPAASETFRKNFPEASFIEGPIEDLQSEDLLTGHGIAEGDIDCVIGGPPCQAFSINNHRRSAEDVRAGLFRDYLRIVEALKPRTLVMENVPGILSVGDGAVVEEIKESLATLGYKSRAKILYAEEYGVPQERRRVFFIATRLGWEDSLIPDGTYGPRPKPSKHSGNFIHRWHRSRGTEYGHMNALTVGAAISDLPEIENGGGSDKMEFVRPPTTQLQNLLRGTEEYVYNHRTRSLSEKMMKRVRLVPEGGSWRDLPKDLLPAGMRRAERNSHTKRYGRPGRRSRSCTILTKCDPHWGSYIHPKQDRTLSVRETARLQSFPDRFCFYGGIGSQYTQVGNAVPPLLAAAIANAVKQHLMKQS